MEWNTIPLELLERILIFTASPQGVVIACKTCKSWNRAVQDQHLWKSLYFLISCAQINDASNIDWKQKVMDLVLVRENVKHGRCVVRTLATTQALNTRTKLDLPNATLHKDYFLGGWHEVQHFGSFGGTGGSYSYLVNMVTEEYTKMTAQTSFLNHYVANSTSGTYGGANYKNVKVKRFDPTAIQSYSPTGGVEFALPNTDRTPMVNHCSESRYVAFSEPYCYYSGPKIFVVNAETGAVVYSQNATYTMQFESRLYDKYLAVYRNNTLQVIDVTTNNKTTRVFKSPFLLGFMTASTIIVYTRSEVRLNAQDKVIMWNFKDGTETVYPVGDMPYHPITMIYNNMWLIFHESKLAFFDMKSGSLINTLALRQCGSKKLVLLSDGRLGVAQRSGCRVISFFDSEVNRKITVEVIDIEGKKTSHQISAHELAQFFVSEVKKPHEAMISRVVSYTELPSQSDERFVMIFSQVNASKSHPVNDSATKLLKTAAQPTYLNTPYQGWKFDANSILLQDCVVDRVCGKAIIVREKKIDGRWQLVSMETERA